MSDVKRYHADVISENEEGCAVLYSDYTALRQQLADMTVAKEDAERHLCHAIIETHDHNGNLQIPRLFVTASTIEFIERLKAIEDTK